MQDGPFAEAKEQLPGFFIVDCEGLDQAIEAARDLAHAWPDTGACEIHPLAVFRPGGREGASDLAWIDAALALAAPQAVGALRRYFRGHDAAEEAFQNACLRVLKA